MERQNSEPEFRAFRKRTLTYSLVVSCVGLPVGIVLNLPYVWILSIAGIIISSLKLSKMKGQA
ncbi:MAG: hypothetical protein WC770_02980 [Phycisphaerae bacterium]|jgi:hypothetical protein